MEAIIVFTIIGTYYFIGYKVANKLEAEDSYEKHIIASAFPIFLIAIGLVNLLLFIKERIKKHR